MIRTGIGYDIHPLTPNRPLILGGVTLAHPEGKGLLGHSDADVLSHAIADALLGAAGKPDIGHYFPNTDPNFKDISSLLILEKVATLLKEEHYHINNIDATLIAETPKIAPHITSMKETIATALTITSEQIGLKATTHELLGSIGRGEGIAAMAVATLAIRPTLKTPTTLTPQEEKISY